MRSGAHYNNMVVGSLVELANCTLLSLLNLFSLALFFCPFVLLSSIINDNVQKVFCSIILPLEQEGVRRSRVGVGNCSVCV